MKKLLVLLGLIALLAISFYVLAVPDNPFFDNAGNFTGTWQDYMAMFGPRPQYLTEYKIVQSNYQTMSWEAYQVLNPTYNPPVKRSQTGGSAPNLHIDPLGALGQGVRWLMRTFFNLFTMNASATYPVLEAVNSGNSGANTTSHTVNMPAGVVSGDLLIACIAVDGNTTLTWPVVGTWTALSGPTNNGGAVTLECRYRVSDGTEGASITITTLASEGSAYQTWRIGTGTYSGTPEAGTPTTGTSVAPDAPSLTVSWNKEDTFWLVVEGNDGNVAVAAINPYPPYTSNKNNPRWANVDGVGVAVANTLHNQNSHNPQNYVLESSEQWVANTIAVRPAVACTTSPQTSGYARVQCITEGYSVNATSHTVNMPLGVVNGDLLIVVFTRQSSGTVTWPASWVQIATGTGNEVRYFLATGAMSSITITSSSTITVVYISYRITNYSGTPEAASTTGTSTTPDPPNLTPSWGSVKALWFATFGLTSGAGHDQDNPTTPTNYLRQRLAYSTVGPGVSSLREFEAASENPSTYGHTASIDWFAVTIAVQPSVVGNDRYWVGGTGNWNDTAHWSDSSGGSSGVSVPTSLNMVFFDANSGGGTATVNVNAATNDMFTANWTGTIAIGTFNFAVNGTLAHSGGVITIGSSSGTGLTTTVNLLLNVTASIQAGTATEIVSVTQLLAIQSSSAYIDFGAGTWTITQNCTCSYSNASTNANWDAGTGTINFTSATAQNFTFAGTNLSEPEFNNVIMGSSAAGQIVFTMITRGFNWGGSLSLASNTTLATSNLALTGGSLIVFNDGGVLTANASTISTTDVTMSGAGGTITLTSAAWTASGNWNTSGSSSTFTAGTSTVTLSGASKTVATRSGASNGFYNLTVSGSITQSTAVPVSTTLTISGILNTADFTISGSDKNIIVTSTGTFNANASALTMMNLTMTGAGGTITITTGTWTVNGNWNTTGAGSVLNAGTGTVTMTGATQTANKTLDMLAGQAFYNLAITTGAFSITMSTAIAWTGVTGLLVANGTLVTAGFAMTGGQIFMGSSGTLIASTSTVSVTNVIMSGVTGAAIIITSASWTVSGNWTVAANTFDSGTSTITMTGTSKTLTAFAGDEFYNLVISGTVSQLSMIEVSVTLTISGTLTTSGFGVTGGDLSISSTGSLVASTSTISLDDVSMTEAGGSISMTSGQWTITGNWNTTGVGSTLSAGTGQVTMTGASQTANKTLDMRTGQSFYNLVIQTGAFAITMGTAIVWTGTTGLLIAAGTLVTAGFGMTGGQIFMGTSGTLIASTSTVSITSVFMTGVTGAAIILTSGFWSVSGPTWNLSAETFDQGTSTIIFTGSTTITMHSNNEFYDFNISGGTATLASQLEVFNNMVLSGGVLAKNIRTIDAVGSLTMSGGAIISTSGNVVIGGAVNISSASSYIDFGSETWFLGGSGGDWTNSSTSASWDAGTGTVQFYSPTNQIMTFAGSNLAEPEFNNVLFESQSASPRTFTMSTRGLRWAGTLTVQDGSSTTTLATSGLALTGGALSIGNNGILTANASTVSVASVSMVGGASGTITVTTGTWSIVGSWNTSGVGSTFTEGTTSTYTFTGTGTLTMRVGDNTFPTLIANGITTMAQSVVVIDTLFVGGILTAGNNNITAPDIEATGSLAVGTGNLLGVVTLNIDGTMTMDGYTVGNMFIETNTGTFDITSWNAWTVTGTSILVSWTFTVSAPGTAIIITVENVPDGMKRLLRDGTQIDSDLATPTLTFTKTGGWGTNLMVINRELPDYIATPLNSWPIWFFALIMVTILVLAYKVKKWRED